MALKAFELFSIRSKKTNPKKSNQTNGIECKILGIISSLCMLVEEEIERHRRNRDFFFVVFLFFEPIAVAGLSMHTHTENGKEWQIRVVSNEQNKLNLMPSYDVQNLYDDQTSNDIELHNEWKCWSTKKKHGFRVNAFDWKISLKRGSTSVPSNQVNLARKREMRNGLFPLI